MADGLAMSPDLWAVRTITSFVRLTERQTQAEVASTLQRAVTHLRAVKSRIESSLNATVQTIRIAVNVLELSPTSQAAHNWAQQVSQALELESDVLVSLGTASHQWMIEPGALTSLMTAYPTYSCSFAFDTEELLSHRFHQQISCSLAREVAWTILEIARSSAGAANFRFGVSFGAAPSLTPFFPAACSSALARDSSPAFAFGLENSALLVAACRAAAAKADERPDLEAVGQSVERAWESVLRRLTQVGLQCEWNAAQEGSKFVFKGTDTSINPCMRPGQGIGDAYQLVLKGGLGAPGTVALTERLTRAIRAAGAMQTGYRGAMLALAEDPSLAALANEGRVSAGLLLAWAAVCGVGVDTVPCPCPDRCTKEEDEVMDGLMGVLLDAAALSRRLNEKPLSVRFLPVPGKKAGDLAAFDSPHLVPSMIIPRLGHGA